MAFREYTLERFGFNLSHAKPSKYILITFISRKNVDRAIRNEVDVLDKIRQVCNHFCVLKVVDFQTMTFYQQIELATQTDVLIGVHGAGNLSYFKKL
jgi:capsular polysaccharide biosynthesis protein